MNKLKRWSKIGLASCMSIASLNLTACDKGGRSFSINAQSQSFQQRYFYSKIDIPEFLDVNPINLYYCLSINRDHLFLYFFFTNSLEFSILFNFYHLILYKTICLFEHQMSVLVFPLVLVSQYWLVFEY